MDEEESSEQQGTVKSVQKAGGRVARAARKVGRAVVRTVRRIATSIAAAIGFIAGGGWIVILILVAVLILAAIITSMSMSVSVAINGVYENGKFTPSAGAVGDKFYGERFFYFDTAHSNEEIANTYITLSTGLITTELSLANSTLSLNASNIDAYSAQISINFAKSVSSLTDSEKPLTYYTGGIDHYGLTSIESNTFLTTMAEYLHENGCAKNENTATDIKEALENIYNNDFAYMKNVCSRILIKDYIFNSETEGIIEMESKNYQGVVFMPKENLTITNTEFAFIVPQGYTVEASYNYVENGVPTEITTAVADSTWFEDGVIKNDFEINLTDYSLTKFEAIDENDINYLSNGVSLFKILKDGKLNNYFKDATNVDENTSVTDLLNNIKTNNYQYLKCNCDGYYIVADVLTEY